MQKTSPSFWERASFLSGIDLAVIGSGIVGLSAAIHFKERRPQSRVVVLERGALPLGASTRNAGFACFGSLTELMDDLEKQAEDQVFVLVEKRWRGLQRLRSRIGDAVMDFQLSGNFEIFREDEEQVYQKCLDQIEYFNKKVQPITGSASTYCRSDEAAGHFGFKNVKHLIKNSCEGQLHTGKMMRRLISLAQEKGVEIFSGVQIENLEDSTSGPVLETAQGWELRPAKVLAATNGFARQLLPALDVQPARNQVIITHPVPGLKVKGCFHYDRGYVYFRNVDDRILLGGARNLDFETEKTEQFGDTDLIQRALSGLMSEMILPGQKWSLDMCWSGIMGVGPEKKPIVQKWTENIAVAVRMGGMGVAIGTLVGEEGAELLI